MNKTFEKNADKVDKINKDFSDRFDGLHNTLWQILINDSIGGKVAAFTPIVGDGFYTVGVAPANESGYIPTATIIKASHYTKAAADVAALNLAVFDLDEKAALEIVASSMFTGKAAANA